MAGKMRGIIGGVHYEGAALAEVLVCQRNEAHEAVDRMDKAILGQFTYAAKELDKATALIDRLEEVIKRGRPLIALDKVHDPFLVQIDEALAAVKEWREGR